MQGFEITTQALPIGQFVVSLKNHLKREPSLRNVVLRGELSKFHKHQSGHIYLTLKDSQGQLDAVMWGAARTIQPEITVGKEVVVIASVDLYPPQGRIQLVIEKIQLLNDIGILEAEKRKLIEKLRMEGALDRPRMPLPILPKHIVMLTGANSAALSDMLRISTDRFPNVRITVIPVAVQGDKAVSEICRGIDAANFLSEPKKAQTFGLPSADLVILARGGGAPEDLWSFNLEPVIRKIMECKIPLISAIGHESDVLVSDLVADMRASTPSRAVELAIPDFNDMLFHLSNLEERKKNRILSILSELNQQTNILQLRLAKAPTEGIRNSRSTLSNLDKRLLSSALEAKKKSEQTVDSLQNRLSNQVNKSIIDYNLILSRCEAILKSTNPNNVLDRGYSMVQDSQGKVITSISQVSTGEIIDLRLNDGVVKSKVESKG